jgi:putative ABC transport system permease protein
MDVLISDLRYTIRNLARTPGFSLTVILVMALGIGATAALFTVVNSVLLKPLPLPDADRLVMVYEADTILKFDSNYVAGGTFQYWRDQNRTLQQIAVSTDDEYNLSAVGGQLPERIEAEICTWQALPLLGVKPAYGRLFTADDDKFGASETTVLTWGFWKRRFGGDPSIIGRSVYLDAKPFTVIGVLPAWFTYPNPQAQLWTPLYPETTPQMMNSHDSHNFRVIAKLRPGVSLEAAEADLKNISFQRRKQYPAGPVFNSAHLRRLLDSETYQVKTLLYALFAATACLLFIACLNIANLLVARSAARRKETAIRTALGGSRGRLVRDRVLESVVLALTGSLFGILLAELGLHRLVSLRADLPRVEAIHLDLIAVLFSVGIATLCGVVAGLAPALVEDEQQILQTLQESSRSVSGSRTSLRLRRALLAIEVALTVVLLVGAGLFLRSYQKLRAVDVGVPTSNVLTMTIDLPDAGYKEGPKKIAFYEQLLSRVRALPGVRAIGLGTQLPGRGHGEDDAVTIAENPPLAQGAWQDAMVRFVDPGFFQALHIRLLEGRVFSPDDRLARSRYAVVSAAFVKQFLNGKDPIGKHVNDLNNAPEGSKDPANEIVGMVSDVLTLPNDKVRPTVYYPLYNGLSNDVVVAVRTAADPLALAMPVQRIVAQLDPNLPVANILTLDDVVGKSTAQASFDAVLLSIFAALSLILAAVGLFGVLSYIVAQRTSEIGVRIALGAQREQVMRLMLADGLRPAVIGLVLGLVVSAGVTRLIQSLLYGVAPFDPVVFLAVSLALLAVAAIACLIPAWRASRLDPIDALRNE